MKEIRDILAERGSKHGDFTEQAAKAQQLKYAMNLSDNWNDLEPYKREALDMIQHKVARILTGDSNFTDHWVDIIGYAQLVLDRIGEE